MGLFHEMNGARNAASCALWVDLIERYVDLLAEPWQREKRLLALWNVVRKDLAHQWSIKEFAEITAMSGEHLRRRCQRSIGRSPMQQLIVLRIQHAAHLLATTEAKIEAISQQVGYKNPFAFSNTFKRITGVRPSQFRMRRSST
jgi:transcriptional regulator GlxA family with amidase domain